MEKEEKKRGFIMRTATAPFRILSGLVGVTHIQSGAEGVGRLAKAIDPRKYPLAKAAEWMNPPRNEIGFGNLMRQNGLSEADLQARHRACALTVYALALVAGGAVAAGVAGAIGGRPVMGLMAAFGGAGLAAAVGFKYSLMSMQLRYRSLNLDFKTWKTKPWQWLPPLDLPPPPKRVKKGEKGEVAK